MSTPLPITEIVNVTVNITPVGAPTPNLNLGLIIGTSTVISASTRVKVYNNLAAMATDGFATNTPEYLAATMYFAQAPQPQQVAIGRQATGESCLQAVQACRIANTQWYSCYVPGAGASDHSAIAAYVETLTNPFATYFMETNSSTVLSNATGNIFATLGGAKYKRTQGMYTGTTYTAAGVMGIAMGRLSTQAQSAFTLAQKAITGSQTDSLTQSQVNNVFTNNGNIYVNISNNWSTYLEGSQFSGNYFDQIAGVDLLVSLLETNIMNLLTSVSKVPYTEDGMGQLRTVCSQACSVMVQAGYIAPSGVWNGAPVLTLATGATMPAGFVVMSNPISGQTSSQIATRTAPQIYVCLKLAEAIDNVLITVNVQA